MQATQTIRQFRRSGFQTLNSIVVSIFSCASVVAIGATFIGAFGGLVI